MTISVTEPSSEAGLARAGFVTRAAAGIADAAILFVMLRGSVWILNAMSHTLRRFAPPIDLASLLVATFPLVIGAYFVAFWWAFGRTPGKWLLGVKVVCLGGGRVGFWRAALRLVGYLFSALPFYLGFLWILGSRRQGWHDQLAGTEVIYLNPRRVLPHRDESVLALPPRRAYSQ